jgi:cyclophilin family peptidyl-prolyl cis-trans isomerase
MLSVGVHTNGSQFQVSYGDNEHLNGRCVVFGRLASGEDILNEIESSFTFRGVPSKDIKFVSCEVAS